MNHLLLLPILIPMLGAVAALCIEHRRYGPRMQRAAAWISMIVLSIAVIALFASARDGLVRVYLLGDWPARLGIALMGDRLSAWMLLTTALLGCACLLHACGGWDQRVPHFHCLFQFQLMGLNGTFLTGDIFNLFVFFEVMLIASYGLLLSGGHGQRMRIGLHYVLFNAAVSTLFLIALGVLYGVFGSLNMAELSQRIAQLPAQQVALAKVALGLLLLVFSSKAALLPLYLWLPDIYARAPAAIAALFTIMTKVGLYAILRVSSLWFGIGAGALQGFGRTTMLWLGVGTVLLSGFGTMAASRLPVMVSYLVILSAATLFIAFSLDETGAIGAGVYYLPHSSFVTAALFMIADLTPCRRGSAKTCKDAIAPIAASRTMAGTLFLIAAIAVAGLPPLSGFLAKVALLQHVPPALTRPVWATILTSSLLVVIGLIRTGVRLFWDVPEHRRNQPVPAPSRYTSMATPEIAAILLLLCGVLGMTFLASPLMRDADAAGAQLHDRNAYIEQMRASVPQGRLP